tara:strand:+ start:1583 stop:1948 length:366 start_codon:yes stop_codon:yes gene_type:complete
MSYDATQTIILEGIVTNLDWKFPHVVVFIDVEEDGNIFSWTLPTGSPNALSTNGMTPETVAVGEKIIISGWPSRDGSREMRARTLIQKDGAEWALHPVWSEDGNFGGVNNPRDQLSGTVSN